LKRLAAVLASLVLLGALALAWQGLSARPEDADAALVFGNKIDPSGVPSRRLESRLEAARQLYLAKRVRYVLVSGGVGKEAFDEAWIMARWLRVRGVPDSVLILDSQGIDTRATCENARALLAARGASSVDVVTQWFHVPRAQLAARRAGLDVRGAAWPLLRAARRSTPSPASWSPTRSTPFGIDFRRPRAQEFQPTGNRGPSRSVRREGGPAMPVRTAMRLLAVLCLLALPVRVLADELPLRKGDPVTILRSDGTTEKGTVRFAGGGSAPAQAGEAGCAALGRRELELRTADRSDRAARVARGA
jgi:uncharacterized SAM-binding protein YcdF (DUF218 family)